MPPLNDSTLNLMGLYLETLISHAQLHSADPGGSGTSNVTTAARQPVAFDVDADGDLSITGTVAFTGVAASGAVTHVTFWSASTGGTWRGTYAVVGDQAANTAGEFNVTGIVITGTST